MCCSIEFVIQAAAYLSLYMDLLYSLTCEKTYSVFFLFVVKFDVFTGSLCYYFDVYFGNVPFSVIVGDIAVSSKEIRPWKLTKVVVYLFAFWDFPERYHGHQALVLQKMRLVESCQCTMTSGIPDKTHIIRVAISIEEICQWYHCEIPKLASLIYDGCLSLETRLGGKLLLEDVSRLEEKSQGEEGNSEKPHTSFIGLIRRLRRTIFFIFELIFL